jgi:hypothetical protein
MSATKKLDDHVLPETRLTASPALLEAGAYPSATPSPARLLQESLSSSFAHDDEKWSLRRTATFLIIFCGGFWLCAGIGISRALNGF